MNGHMSPMIYVRNLSGDDLEGIKRLAVYDTHKIVHWLWPLEIMVHGGVDQDVMFWTHP
jgi:hypothetical protein